MLSVWVVYAVCLMTVVKQVVYSTEL